MTLEINELSEYLEYIPDWFFVAIIILLLLDKVLKPLEKILSLLSNTAKLIRNRYYDPETRQFIAIRKNFVEHLSHEVEKLNRDADWNDFHYTELEAEVEVDYSHDLDIHHSKIPIVWLYYLYRILYSLYHIVRKFIGISPASKVQKNLTQAIRRSKSRSFLVIGDPGSGKTVSLRHLSIEMAKICASSKDKTAVVPIYLNLKHLNMQPDEVDADKIHGWVVEQLRANQDRTVHEFLDENFEPMLKDGAFFFLFDSFDEIPAVMDAQEEQEIVRQYADALYNFLHSPHRCRGLVSSRPYRAPKISMGQKMTILPLSNKRIKDAIDNYMGQQSVLADQIWYELVQSRKDMLDIAENPFYLGLLTRYAKDKKRLPERHYDLFEHFVQNRAQTDESHLRRFGLTSDELVEQASILAFAMISTPDIGLEANIDQVHEVTNGFDETSGWDSNNVESLLHALAYSKLGRMSQEGSGTLESFGFVHRRFHEYFCARYLKQNPEIAPFENLAADDRWREVLVLLCEILPSDQLTDIFNTARSALTAGINADSGSIEHRKAVESIRFLRDGFHNRIEDIPSDIRVLCSTFIQKQLETGTLLDQKRAVEGVSIADYESIPVILESALTSDSAWLRETALRSCRILRTVPEQIAKAMRYHLHHHYADLKIHQDYSFYSVLFSATPTLHPFKSFSKILLTFALLQVLLFAGTTAYGLMFDTEITRMFLTILFMVLFATTYKRLMGVPHRHSSSFICFWSIIGIVCTGLFIGQYRQSPSFLSGGLLLLYFFFLLSNVFLFSLISDYPHSTLAWLLYPMRVMRKVLEAVKTFFSNWKSYLGDVAFILAIAFIFGGFLYWLDWSFELLQSHDYSIVKIYSVHSFTQAAAILLPPIASGIMAIYVAWETLLGFVRISRDQIKLAKLYIFSESRPSTASKAIQILHSFKSDVGKVQYISALFKWLPVGTDPQIFIKEASEHRGTVCDKLYQLAEIWEDSMRKSR